MASGVKIEEEVKKAFDSLKLKRHCKYLVLGMTEDLKQVKVLKEGHKHDRAWETFKDDLIEAENLKQCRYAVYDYHYKKEDGTPNSKLVLFSWSPSNATVKQRMVYAATKSALKTCLDSGFALDKETFEMNDLDVEEINKELRKK